MSTRRTRSPFVAPLTVCLLAAGVPTAAFAGPPEGDADGSVSLSTDSGGEAAADVSDDADGEEKCTKGWVRCFAPERNMGEIGLYGGLFFANDNHDFYNPSTRPAEPLWLLSADLGLRGAYFPLSFLGIEAEGGLIPTRVRNANDDSALLYTVRGHLLLQLPIFSVVPFLLGGAGVMGVSSGPNALGNDADPAAHWGGGVKVHLNKWLALRLEGRHVLAARASEQQNVVSHGEILLGLSVTLRPKPKPIPPPDPDRDKDGFLNEVDMCPDTAGVDPDGCPPKDSDGDGFMDPDDACPDEPGVEPDGCPIPDTDGDGFLDPDDGCPDEPETKNGFEDNDGCPDEIPEEVKVFTGVIAGIEFEFRKSDIRPGSKPVLDKAIALLKEYPDLRLEISGHTDNVGTREVNVELSKARADAVREYLVAGGIDESRLVTRGAGPDEPIGDNETEEGRAKNRRTEFKIIEQAKAD